MAFKLFKLPKFTLPRWSSMRPSGEVARKMTLAGLLAAALITAFYWGRHGARNEARGQSPSSLDPMLLKKAAGDHGRYVVAYIFGDIPITREELGEYLVERMGAERIELLINRKIVEKACADKGIRITDTEVNAQFAEELKTMNLTEAQFVSAVLRKYDKSLFEYKEDVIRLKMALKRYVQQNVTINEQEIQKGFEAKFGPKVECLLIAMTKEVATQRYDIWTRARRGKAEFIEEAKKVNPGPLAAESGKIPLIHKHFGDPNIEEEAFKLKEGDISSLIALPDGTHVILHCVKQHPADTTKSLDQERLTLHKELFDGKVAQMIPAVVQEMRKAANPQVFLKREIVAGAPTLTSQMPQPPAGMVVPAATIEKR